MDSEVNDPRHVWYCGQCVRRMREMVSMIIISLSMYNLMHYCFLRQSRKQKVALL